MASSRNPKQTPTRTPTRLTEDGLATVMNGMDLQKRSSHQSLRPQTPVSLPLASRVTSGSEPVYRHIRA